MSAKKLFKYIIVLSNLILMLLPILGILFIYLFYNPKLTEQYIWKVVIRPVGIQTLTFAFWGIITIIVSICFTGVAFTKSVPLHLIAALFLCGPLALSVWLIVEQFLFLDSVNYLVVSLLAIASLIWTVQILSELCLACILCCQPDKKKKGQDERLEKGHDDEDVEARKQAEDGTDEEKEKLVICAAETHLQDASAPPLLPGAPPIEEEPEDEDEDDEDDEDEDEDDEDEDDGQDEENAESPNQTKIINNLPESEEYLQQAKHNLQELPLQTIPEEKQHLLGGGVQCPLATPEDTGV